SARVSEKIRSAGIAASRRATGLKGSPFRLRVRSLQSARLMSLSAGTRLGSYEILALLGAGGMGEVYRARDTKLNRDVALKVLPDTVAPDGEPLARFKREAQVLSALNHPHIGAIYGVDEANGTQF